MTRLRAKCKGDWSLGTACGRCSHCEETRPPVPPERTRGGMVASAALASAAARVAVCPDCRRTPAYCWCAGYNGREPLPHAAVAMCKGSWELGSACGICSRCIETWPAFQREPLTFVDEPYAGEAPPLPEPPHGYLRIAVVDSKCFGCPGLWVRAGLNGQSEHFCCVGQCVPATASVTADTGVWVVGVASGDGVPAPPDGVMRDQSLGEILGEALAKAKREGAVDQAVMAWAGAVLRTRPGQAARTVIREFLTSALIGRYGDVGWRDIEGIRRQWRLLNPARA